MNKSIVIAATSAAIVFSIPSGAAASPAQCASLVERYRAEIDTASRYGALNQALGDKCFSRPAHRE
jgi:hypothetical protein